MRVVVVTEAHFRRDSDGTVFSDTGGRGYNFWKRYLDVFSSVTVLGRVSPRTGAVAYPVEGPDVSLVALPGYKGPYEFCRLRRKLQDLVQQTCGRDAACIARVPGALGTLVVNERIKHRQPYGLEVVGDPAEAFAPGAIRHPLRPVIRRYFARQMRRECERASAVAYVTEYTLQQRYPCGPGAFTTNYSSVELPEAAFVAQPRTISAPVRKATLIQVGTQSQFYKGHDVLINALSLCLRSGFDIHLILIGDGRHRAELEAQVKSLGLQGHVQFLGQLPAGDAVRAQLDLADLFVMPSRTEGLPRAMIEAMARGVPCIGSNIGGIPELLPAEDLFLPGQVSALADKIQAVLSDPVRMQHMSVRNLAKARHYHDEVLRCKRIEFYRYVKSHTEKSSSGMPKRKTH